MITFIASMCLMTGLTIGALLLTESKLTKVRAGIIFYSLMAAFGLVIYLDDIGFININMGHNPLWLPILSGAFVIMMVCGAITAGMLTTKR